MPPKRSSQPKVSTAAEVQSVPKYDAAAPSASASPASARGKGPKRVEDAEAPANAPARRAGKGRIDPTSVDDVTKAAQALGLKIGVPTAPAGNVAGKGKRAPKAPSPEVEAPAAAPTKGRRGPKKAPEPAEEEAAPAPVRAKKGPKKAPAAAEEAEAPAAAPAKGRRGPKKAPEPVPEASDAAERAPRARNGNVKAADTRGEIAAVREAMLLLASKLEALEAAPPSAGKGKRPPAKAPADATVEAPAAAPSKKAPGGKRGKKVPVPAE